MFSWWDEYKHIKYALLVIGIMIALITLSTMTQRVLTHTSATKNAQFVLDDINYNITKAENMSSLNKKLSRYQLCLGKAETLRDLGFDHVSQIDIKQLVDYLEECCEIVERQQQRQQQQQQQQRKR